MSNQTEPFSLDISKTKIKSYKKNDILYDSGKSLIDIITSD